MENCLLCLESTNNSKEHIKVNSEVWNQRGIKSLIDKHLWPMDTISFSSWICLECVKEIQTFHDYYIRIEKAHAVFPVVIKKEDEPIIFDEQDNEKIDDSKDCYIKQEYADGQIMSQNFEIEVARIKTEKVDEDPEELKEFRIEDTQIKTEEIEQNTESESDELLEETELKSKSPRNFDDDDYSDDNAKSGKKDTTKKKKRKKADEYDQIIAQHFKIECCVCQTTFEDFISLRRHFKAKHRQSGYVQCCNRNFFSRSVLADHIHVHLNPEFFKCQECNKVLSDRSSLTSHMKLHEIDSTLEKCDKCGKAFENIEVLKKHILTHASDNTSFPCKTCGKCFKNASVLNRHIEVVHEDKFVQVCGICGKHIRCPTAFTCHMEKHGGYDVSVRCDVCGLLLSNNVSLKRHKNSQHPVGGKMDHKCQICSKVSPTLRALRTHIRRTHEVQYNYKCSLCDKAFKRLVSLREHMAAHMGTALYTCPWCPKTFISNGNMYNHRKNAHPKEWEELKRQKYDADTVAEANMEDGVDSATETKE